LVWISTSHLSAGLPGPAGTLERTGTPALVALGSKQELDRQAARFRALLEEDGILDRKVAGRTLAEDPNGAPTEGSRLRKRLGLGCRSSAWVLLGRDGRVLASGGTLPGPEVLIQALEAAGEQSPVALLEAFLKERPEHTEARMDLIRALGNRLQARLQDHSFSGNHDLTPEADARIWGPVARELGLLFQDESWIGSDLNLDLLPEDVPERSSPLMKALYRRHQAQLLAGLRRFPDNPTAWLNLLRMNRTLNDEGLTRSLEGIGWFQAHLADTAALPYGPVARSLHREAMKTGDWRQAMAALQILWREWAVPRLELLDQETERTAVWTQLLAPLIEAMCRSGNEASVPPLLGELDESWAQAGIPERLSALARASCRPELAPIWCAAARTPAERTPREGRLGHELVVFYQGQKDEEHLQPWRYDPIFRKQGMTAGLYPVPISWVRRLGWAGPGPRWALVDARGRVLLQGEWLPKEGELFTACQAKGLANPLDRVEAFRKEHPAHLGALAAEARIREVIARAHLSGRQVRPTAGLGRNRLDGTEIAAWQAYFAVLQTLLEDPMGTCHEPLRRAQVRLPAPAELSWDDGPTGAGALAQRLLPRLESDLARRPSDPELWQVWLTLAAHVDRPLAPLLDRLAPSPLAPPGAWPPDDLLAQVAESLKCQARWQDLADLLLRRWKARMEMVERFQQAGRPAKGNGSHPAWSWQWTRPLLEALQQLGRTRQADEMMEALAAPEIAPGSWDGCPAGARIPCVPL